MFNVNDKVMYLRNGVCTIKDIRTENFSGSDREYYIITPEKEPSSTVYVPMEKADEKFKRLLSREEICDIIEKSRDNKAEWIEDNKQRREKSLSVINSGNHGELILLIKLYRAKKSEFEQQHKKFFIADEKILCEAESILYQEFSAVLNIPKEEVFSFINDDLRLA